MGFIEPRQRGWTQAAQSKAKPSAPEVGWANTETPTRTPNTAGTRGLSPWTRFSDHPHRGDTELRRIVLSTACEWESLPQRDDLVTFSCFNSKDGSGLSCLRANGLHLTESQGDGRGFQQNKIQKMDKYFVADSSSKASIHSVLISWPGLQHPTLLPPPPRCFTQD